MIQCSLFATPPLILELQMVAAHLLHPSGQVAVGCSMAAFTPREFLKRQHLQDRAL